GALQRQRLPHRDPSSVRESGAREVVAQSAPAHRRDGGAKAVWARGGASHLWASERGRDADLRGARSKLGQGSSQGGWLMGKSRGTVAESRNCLTPTVPLR